MAPTVPHMVLGDGDTSYARNSTLQGGEQGNLKPMVEEAIVGLLDGGSNGFPGGMAIADLGCSFGPNTLVLVSTAVDAVRRRCLQLRQESPELSVHLNDLPNNDFNAVIKSLAAWRETREGLGPVLTSIVPGSFHGRLFRNCSLHLVCSNASLHWLSKAPEDLARDKIPFYDRDEAVRRARRPVVLEAYARQFNKDFTRFLGLRAQEMAPGGRMVFSVSGQRSDDNVDSSLAHLELMFEILHELASMGLIDNEKLDSFYVPLYAPLEKELREIIEAEGSFSINNMAVHEPTIIVGRGSTTPRTRACGMRAIFEPIIQQHFGSPTEAMDEYVRIAEKLIKISPHDKYPHKSRAFIAVSLTKK